MELTHDTDGRLEVLENHAQKTETRLGVIEGIQRAHGDKLDQIVTAVTRYDARPVFDMHKSVSMVRDAFVVLATLASLSVWLVVTLTSASDSIMALELKFQRRDIDELRQITRNLNTTTILRTPSNGN